jgi:hypothetical protein
MAKLLKLDTFVLDLDIGENFFRKLAEGSLPPFSVFRTFNVAKSFELETFICFSDESRFEDDEEHWDYLEDLKDELLDRVKDFLCPDALKEEGDSNSNWRALQKLQLTSDRKFRYSSNSGIYAKHFPQPLATTLRILSNLLQVSRAPE